MNRNRPQWDAQQLCRSRAALFWPAPQEEVKRAQPLLETLHGHRGAPHMLRAVVECGVWTCGGILTAGRVRVRIVQERILTAEAASGIRCMAIM